MFERFKHILASWHHTTPALPFSVLFKKFQGILERNNRILELMADMGDKLGGEYVFDSHYIEDAAEQLGDLIFKLISDFNVLTQEKNGELFFICERVQRQIQEELAGRHRADAGERVVFLDALGHELAEQVGMKMAELGDVRNRLNLSTPPGFVITTRCHFELLVSADLLKTAQQVTGLWKQQDLAAIKTLAEEMQQAVLQAQVPKRIHNAILNAYDQLALSSRQPDLQVILRSSAWGEGGRSSFAGQYASILNLNRDQLLDGYRQVIASSYGYEAWIYRLEQGFHEKEMAMAVGCQVMSPGVVSGVMQSFTPHATGGAILVNASWGLCAPLVQGSLPVDTFILARSAPYPSLKTSIRLKRKKLSQQAGGGTSWENLPEEQHAQASLNSGQLQQLAEAALTIERYYKRPQEIEWSFDPQGTLQILQTRLSRDGQATSSEKKLGNVTQGAEILFSGKGCVAQRGVAVGQVFMVREDADLEHFPHGAILVSRYTSPRYASIMAKAQGIITDMGSPTGHMATLAREYRVPTIVDTEDATRLLSQGQAITMDASQNVVYRGTLCALERFERTEEEVFEDCYEYRLLKRILHHITPLHLVDPQAEAFTAKSCRTYHDLTRYIHEKAVESLIALSERQGHASHSAPKRLETTIPLGLLVIDGGSGTHGPLDAPTLTPAQILSTPLKELLIGIEKLGLWCTDPVTVNLGSFMSSFTRTFCASLARPEEIGRNLVVVQRHYMNINLRLGYHFTIIDAYLCENINDNYIYFRFLGGVTEFIRRSRRASFIAQVLQQYDFRVEIHGDLVVGRLKKMPFSRMTERMRMLGGLVAYTRQLDARMHSDSDITDHVTFFLQTMREVSGG